MLLEDAQVEAWHEAPDLSIEAGGAFHSKGPLTLTRSTLTASWMTYIGTTVEHRLVGGSNKCVSSNLLPGMMNPTMHCAFCRSALKPPGLDILWFHYMDHTSPHVSTDLLGDPDGLKFPRSEALELCGGVALQLEI